MSNYGMVHFTKALALTLALTTVAFAEDDPAGTRTSKSKFLASNLASFGIPFSVNAADASIIEVQLYQSTDRGKSWQFVGRQSTDKTEFPFSADADGEYWFALKCLNRNRQLIPEGLTSPELVILVDTVKPELDFQVESDPSGRVVCRWKATDRSIAPETLKIRYRPVDANPDIWMTVPVELEATARNSGYADQLAWWPETDERDLVVRLSISDRAGNTVQTERSLVIPPAPWRHRSQSTTTGFSNSGGDFTNPNLAASPASTSIAQPGKELQCTNGVCRKISDPQRHATHETTGNQTAADDGRTANSEHAYPGRQRLLDPQKPLVGDPPEFAAPPVPEGFIAESRPDELRGGESTGSELIRSRSIGWGSVPESWHPQTQSAQSTTLQPDPSLAPVPNSSDHQDLAEAAKLPAPNPASQKVVGNQVISESTTMSPSNQFRGPTERIDSPTTPPSLLPGHGPVIGSGISTDSVSHSDHSDWGTALPSANPSTEVSRPSQSIMEAGQGSQPTGFTGHPSETAVDGAPVEMIGAKRFQLNYGIDSIDPSGVARVDLWMTRDGNRWTSWGSDPDQQSPFPVEVEQEGRYGFRIVIHSKDGLTGVGPRTGDLPDMWIHVDTQAPLARITSVPYGRGSEAGNLIINYRVADDYLVLRPIRLAFATSEQGPWTLINDGLRNEGRYVWKPQSNVPDKIFLRLDARDRAGNVGVHILRQPIDVSGLIPRGTIHGVIPIGSQ